MELDCRFRGDSVVFVGSHSGRFCALDRALGKCCWLLQVPGRIESSACLSRCGRYVSFGCYDHYIYCVQVARGELQWVFRTGSEVKSSPCVDRTRGSLACGSHDKHLYCLDFEVICLSSLHVSPFLCEVSKYQICCRQALQCGRNTFWMQAFSLPQPFHTHPTSYMWHLLLALCVA